MQGIIGSWIWIIYGFATGVLFLLVGYSILGANEPGLQRNRRFLKVLGIICILISIFVLAMQLLEQKSG